MEWLRVENIKRKIDKIAFNEIKTMKISEPFTKFIGGKPMKDSIEDIYSKLNDLELVSAYGKWLEELKKRKLIRTNNVIGELGESIAIKIYCSTPRLPRLQAAPIGTQNIDAISSTGNRYSIKSTTGKVTGVFYGLNEPDSEEEERVKFEFVIVVIFSKEYEVKALYEIDWHTFLKHRKWHSRMRAWNLSINRALVADATIIFSGPEPTPISETIKTTKKTLLKKTDTAKNNQDD